MRNYYYFSTIRKTIIQFLDMFNDIRIMKLNKSQEKVSGPHLVPIKYGPKDKYYYWAYDRKKETPLPIIGVILNSIEIDTARLTNPQHNITLTRDVSASNAITEYSQPIPYNLSFDVSIWSKTLVDVDQILEQILPFFKPENFISVSIPELEQSFDAKVVLRSASPDVSFDIAEEDYRVVKWTLSFDVQTYLFTPSNSSSLIKKIITKYYTDEDVWDDHQGTETMFTSGGGWEAMAYFVKATGYDDDGDITYEEYEFE